MFFEIISHDEFYWSFQALAITVFYYKQKSRFFTMLRMFPAVLQVAEPLGSVVGVGWCRGAGLLHNILGILRVGIGRQRQTDSGHSTGHPLRCSQRRFLLSENPAVC